MARQPIVSIGRNRRLARRSKWYASAWLRSSASHRHSTQTRGSDPLVTYRGMYLHIWS